MDKILKLITPVFIVTKEMQEKTEEKPVKSKKKVSKKIPGEKSKKIGKDKKAKKLPKK